VEASAEAEQRQEWRIRLDPITETVTESLTTPDIRQEPPERRPEVRGEGDRERGGRRRPRLYAPPAVESDSVGDGRLAPGWLSQVFETIATQGRTAARAPSQERLEDQPTSLKLTGELPSAGFYSAGTDERIESVRELFTFGGGESASPDNGSDPFDLSLNI
jgi:hypothetical protein